MSTNHSIRSQSRFVWAAGAVVMFGLVLLGMAIMWSEVRLASSRDALDNWRAKSLEVIIASDNAQSKMLDRQRIMRGFVMTGDPASLRGYDFGAMQEALWELERSVQDDRKQIRRVRDLYPIILDLSVRTERARMLVERGQRTDALKLSSSTNSDQAITKAKSIFAAIVDAERASLARRQTQEAKVDQLSDISVYVVALFGASLVIIAGAAGWHLLLTKAELREGQLAKRLDDEIRSSEERMRIAHEATGAGTWEFDLTSKALVWSPEMYSLYGCHARKKMTVEEWSGLIHMDGVDGASFFGEAGLRVGKSIRQDFRIEVAGGEQRWISSRAHVVRGDAGLRLIGMDLDVTEHRQMSEQLEILNRMLTADVDEKRRERESMFTRSKDLMCIARYDGSLVSVNPAWEVITGYSEKELLGRQWLDLVVSDDRERALSRVPDLESGGAVSNLVVRVETRDGRTVWLDCTLVSEPEGRRIYGVARDITEARLNEEKLRSAEQQLQQMQKMEAVGQLTGGIAHDFNNMLTPIVGNVDMLARLHANDPKSQRMLASVRQSADRATTLVSRLLSFARKQHLEPQVVDVVSLVTGMEDLVSRALGPLFEVTITAEHGGGVVKVEPNAFENALLNLCVNAKDAMAEGGPLEICIRHGAIASVTDLGLQPGNYVVVSVRDRGHGMDQATMQKAVEPFYTTKAVGKGTGLGLSMVNGMAVQAGGRLILKSQPGRGTVASIWLPRVDADATAVPVASSPAPISIARPLRILVVDDEPLVRHSMLTMLEAVGHSVVGAEDASEALQTLTKSDDFDVLVTDHLMPGMTGLDLIARVKRDMPGMKTLLVTGYTQMEGDPSVLRLGKPFSASGLASAIEEACRSDNIVRLKSHRTA
ncbi:PAS domain S-box protein [Sphingomonas sp. 3-13AW]|uniref:PAS domain S-box protein n=1 Tax=Sphingomonas sp. 3-13AW TaxID=3050450 RepID=UPI003BB4AC05